MQIMMLSTFLGCFICVSMPPNAMATLFSIANALTGGGGMLNYEMPAPPPPPPAPPSLGKMIGDKIDGINTLKTMVLGPLLKLITGLLNKGGGGGAPAAAGGGGGYGGGGRGYGAASYTSAQPSQQDYGSTGAYSSANQAIYTAADSSKVKDKYAYEQDSTYSGSQQDNAQTPNYGANSNLEMRPELNLETLLSGLMQNYNSAMKRYDMASDDDNEVEI